MTTERRTVEERYVCRSPMEYPIEGVTVEHLDNNEAYKRFISKQHSYKCGFFRLMPYNQVLPKVYKKHAKRIHDFDIRNNDVWVSSFPKCGKNIVSKGYYTLSKYRNINDRKKLRMVDLNIRLF